MDPTQMNKLSRNLKKKKLSPKCPSLIRLDSTDPLVTCQPEPAQLEDKK